MSELRPNRIVPRNGLVTNAMGGIIQTVHVSYDSPFDTTTTGGVDTGLTATINMQSASNKLLITCSALWSTISNEAYMALTDSSNNVISPAAARGSRGRYHWGPHYNGAGSNATYHSARESVTLLHAPASTGNFTVKLRIYNINSGQTVALNRNLYDGDRIYDPAGVSTLTLFEVTA